MNTKAVTVIGCILIMVTVAFSGCINSNKSSGSGSITVTDVTGAKVTLKQLPQRMVFTWGQQLYEISAIGGPNIFDKIVGMGETVKTADVFIYGLYCTKIPRLKNITLVGNSGSGTFDGEKVLGLNPDLIVTTSKELTSLSTDLQKFKDAGIPVVVIDYQLMSIKNVTTSTIMLGKIFGQEKRGNTIASFFTKTYDDITSKVKNITTPKPKVYVEVGWTGPGKYANSFASNWFWGASVTIAGGANIADGIVPRYSPMTAEQVLAANPDIIIITGKDGWSASTPGGMDLGYNGSVTKSLPLLQGYTARPGWSGLNAVKNNKVYSGFHEFGNGLMSFISYIWLAQIFYPNEFKDYNATSVLKEFYKSYLPIDYTGIFFLSIGG